LIRKIITEPPRNIKKSAVTTLIIQDGFKYASGGVVLINKELVLNLIIYLKSIIEVIKRNESKIIKATVSGLNVISHRKNKHEVMPRPTPIDRQIFSKAYEKEATCLSGNRLTVKKYPVAMDIINDSITRKII
jgi:hypothetical protein|tara:strand:+ start:1149 stop:1547 length:399 start_codon:yes stop_codon:yes gene_type:complete